MSAPNTGTPSSSLATASTAPSPARANTSFDRVRLLLEAASDAAAIGDRVDADQAAIRSADFAAMEHLTPALASAFSRLPVATLPVTVYAPPAEMRGLRFLFSEMEGRPNPEVAMKPLIARGYDSKFGVPSALRVMAGVFVDAEGLIYVVSARDASPEMVTVVLPTDAVTQPATGRLVAYPVSLENLIALGVEPHQVVDAVQRAMEQIVSTIEETHATNQVRARPSATVQGRGR